jgi:hypothetical protein
MPLLVLSIKTGQNHNLMIDINFFENATNFKNFGTIVKIKVAFTSELNLF